MRFRKVGLFYATLAVFAASSACASLADLTTVSSPPQHCVSTEQFDDISTLNIPVVDHIEIADKFTQNVGSIRSDGVVIVIEWCVGTSDPIPAQLRIKDSGNKAEASPGSASSTGSLADRIVYSMVFQKPGVGPVFEFRFEGEKVATFELKQHDQRLQTTNCSSLTYRGLKLPAKGVGSFATSFSLPIDLGENSDVDLVGSTGYPPFLTKDREEIIIIHAAKQIDSALSITDEGRVIDFSFHSNPNCSQIPK